jgi:hypothetical protein
VTHLTIHPPSWLPLSLAAGALLALATLWLYAPQLAELGRAWRVLLPGLRLVAVAALALSVLRPSVLRPRTPAEEGAILILQDASRSMSVIDVNRPAQNLDLAEALGLLRPQQRTWDEQFAPLRLAVDELRAAQQAALDARTDLDYARLAGRGVREAQERETVSNDRLRRAAQEIAAKAASLNRARALLKSANDLVELLDQRPEGWLRQAAAHVTAVVNALEVARNIVAEEALREDESLRQTHHAVAGMSRFALAEHALTAKESGLLSALDPQTPVYAYRIGSDLHSFVPRQRQQSATAPTTSPDDADDSSTDLAGALAEVGERLRGQDLRAIVLLSDGRQVAPARVSARKVDAAALRAPVLAVQCGRGTLRDRSIVRATVPASVFVGESATAHVEVRSTGLKDEAMDVTLDAPGLPRQTQRVDLVSERAVVEFPLKLTTPGVQRISIGVSHIGSEATDQNNQVERLVKVLNGRINVALVTAAPTWEYQYLRNALLRTPFIQLSDANLAWPKPGDAPRWSMTDEQIARQDVFIFCDVAQSHLSEQQWPAVRRAVSDRGACLIVLLGQESVSNAGLVEMLPWERRSNPVPAPRWQVWPGEEAGYRVVPAIEGDQVESLRLADSAADNRRRWGELPGLFRYAKLPALKPGARKLLIERTSNDPVLTEQRVGLGRAFLLATDETWRWRLRTGERDHDRFWLQLIRYAAEEPYAAQVNGLALDADPVSAEPGQSIHVRARLLDEKGLPLAMPVAPSVEVLRADGSTLRTQPLQSAAGASGRYQSQIEGLPTGQYTLRLQSRDSGGSLPGVAVSVADNGEAEMSDLSPDDANLRRIASASGGELLRIDELPSLPRRLAAVGRTTRPVEYRLWDSPYLFLLVIGCLGVEWAVRKRVGLA